MEKLLAVIGRHDEQTGKKETARGIVLRINDTYGMASEFGKLSVQAANEKKKIQGEDTKLQNIKRIQVTESIAQMTAIYRVGSHFFDLLVTLTENTPVYIQLVDKQEQYKIVHKIKAVNESFHRVEESEVLYLESQHNHVQWHCIDRIITSNDSLNRLEHVLSKDFDRIHRGYLVNRNHIKCIQRCEAIMDNGDILTIPSRKYVEIRDRIAGEREDDSGNKKESVKYKCT